MKKIKSLLLSRTTILAQIIILTIVILTGYVFPQRFSTTTADIEKWRDANPFLVPWVDSIGLDHIYTTPWFAILLFFFMLSLIVSSYEQVKISIQRTFGKDIVIDEKGINIYAAENEVVSEIKKIGYIQLSKQNQTLKRLVKHPWGYWGSSMIHLGIVIVISSALIIVLTEKRGVLYMVEKEVAIPGSPWTIVDTGVLAGAFDLPEAIRLEKVNVDFWESDKLKHLTTNIRFIDPEGNFKKFVIGINNILDYKGLRIYQGTTFGHAFFVELTDKQGRTLKQIFQIDHPTRRDKASYEDFRDDAIPYPVRAHYYVDAERKTMKSNNPLLNLLIVEGNKAIHEVTLKIGESKYLGPYKAQLVKVSLWSAIIFVRSFGMYGVFSGFFVIIMGVSLSYFMPSREFILRKNEKHISVIWKASSFEKFYIDEYRHIIRTFGTKVNHG
jgi:cytochrome c biogenesis protein ResB